MKMRFTEEHKPTLLFFDKAHCGRTYIRLVPPLHCCIRQFAFFPAMYVIFRGSSHRLFTDPFQAGMGMFVITLGEIGDLYAEFDTARHPSAAKV